MNEVEPKIKIENISGRAFLAFPDQTEMLLTEMIERLHIESKPTHIYGDLLYFADIDTTSPLPYWAKTTMLAPKIIHFNSIKDAASVLRSFQRSWAPYNYHLFRRANFIQEKLPHIHLNARPFPMKIPSSPIGLYTLIDENTMLVSEKTSSVFPAGHIIFEEDHENPPSRAYLKLMEALTVSALNNGPMPKEGDFCFEAGASPGGWTWLLTKRGASVFAVDRAELAPSLMKNPLVKFISHDAFTLKPSEIGKCDWVFSDVICYPARLYDWICKWLESGLAKNMICTIKMQGKTDWSLIEKFAALPNSRIVHLNYNKHELTWIYTS